ncbi:MAG: hypothetical protein WCH39_04590 [Schlesneria sp.]
MRSLVVWMKEHVSLARRWVASREVTGIDSLFANEEFPDLIVVLQGWPNEFSVSDVTKLLAFAPLARVVVCYGAWCESDGRNLSIWPPSIRVPVWAAPSRIEREWRLVQEPVAQQALPWSASREEIFAAVQPTIIPLLPPQKILIESPDQAFRQYVSERLHETGHTVCNVEPSVLMFDADPWGSSRMRALNALRLRHPNAMVFALANLVQPPLVEQLLGMGVEQVLPKIALP